MLRQWVMTVIFTPVLLAQSNPQGVGVAVSVQGQITLVRNFSTMPVIEGTVLYAGDSLIPAPSSKAMVLHRNGHFKAIDKSERFYATTTMPFSARLIDRYVDLTVSLSQSAEKYKNQKFRSDSSDPIVLNFPRNSRLQKMPDSLAWETTLASEEFQILVRSYDLDYSWNGRVRGSRRCAMDPQTVLVGHKYYWLASPVSEWASVIPASVWFSVLTEAEARSYNEDRQLLRTIVPDENDTIHKLLLTNLLIQYELYHDAMRTAREVLSEKADNLTAIRFLAEIYDRMDMRMDAKRSLEMTQRLPGHD